MDETFERVTSKYYSTFKRYNIVKRLETYLWLWVFLHIWWCSITRHWELPSCLFCPDDQKRKKNISWKWHENHPKSISIDHIVCFLTEFILKETYYNNRAVLNLFRHARLATRHKLCKCVTWWCSMMSQSHVIKGGTTDEAFQEQCFLWESGASVGVSFQELLHA